MYYADHSPAHFHAWYGEYKALISINDGVIKGEMTARALKMILEWMDNHKEELLDNWNKAQNGIQLSKEPLK